jgi:glycosyltransferase involved in cell wall biosynthesis
VRVFWRVLDQVDRVWLFGPHPLAILFVLLAAFRGRHPTLGVRQDFPAYVRSRHPGRRSFRIAASVLEAAWRFLARRFGVIVVGPDLARRYGRAPRLLEIAVSLVPEDAIVGDQEAAAREYDGRLTLLSVGRLEAEKNPLLLADAFALLRERDPRWELVVVGEGPAAEELERRFDALGLGQHARMAGYVPLGDGLDELYRSSHAFLHVSLTEGLPQVLLEAFAGGLPVVATDVGGVAEAVGDCVLLIPPRDAEAAAARLAEISADQLLRLRLVRSGLAYVGSRTIESETRRVAEFLARTTPLR